MGAASEYFAHIKEAVLTIFDGMAVSASHLVRRPYTIQYPDRTPVRVQDMLPFRYRGILDVDLEICTGCLACERACPINCIVIVCEKNAQTRELTISQFDIDIAKCMYCGLCSEPCPTGSIHHTTEFEGADFSLESLIRRFVADPVVAYKPKKGPEPDPRVSQLLEHGMQYVEEWAQPGSGKPATAAPAAGAAAKSTTPAAAARPAGTSPASAPVAPRPASPEAPKLEVPTPAAASASDETAGTTAAGSSTNGVATPDGDPARRARAVGADDDKVSPAAPDADRGKDEPA